MRTQSASDLLKPEPRPFVKWAGGKSQLLEQMSKYFPQKFERYFEPFLGGGAVFFRLKPKKATLSDKNPELITTYKVIRNYPESLITPLETYQKIRLSKEKYDEIRKMTPKDPIDIAARFIFLNKTCYNGLYRVNSRDKFNVPLGGYKKVPKLFDQDILVSVSRQLKNANVICCDYNAALSKANQGDFVYLDPPYAPTNGKGFTDYTPNSFSDDDQKNLAKMVETLNGRGCFVMLNNSDTEYIRELYSDQEFTKHTLIADRMINSIGSKRKGFSELLILNYTIQDETATLNG